MKINWSWWFMPLISELRKLKQKDYYEFKTALATLCILNHHGILYCMRSCLNEGREIE